MFKVVCIDDKDQLEEKSPKVKKGNIYHVINEYKLKNTVYKDGYKAYAGTYYYLIETGNDIVFWNEMFLVINDEEIDETQLTNSIKEDVGV